MRKFLSVLLFTLLAFVNIAQNEIPFKSQEENWHYIGTPGFSDVAVHFPCVKISHDGFPYVAFVEGSKPFKVVVMKWNGSIWEKVSDPNVEIGNGNNVSLAVNQLEVPYIAFVDSSHGKKISVMKYNGTSWDFLGMPGFPSDGAFASSVNLAISPQGVPYVGFTEFTNSGIQEMVVMKYNGSNWVNVGNPGFSSSWSLVSPCIVFNASGQPIIILQDDIQELKVFKFDGDNWVMVGQPLTTYDNPELNVSIAIDTNGTLYVPIVDYTQDSKLSVMQFNGNEWIPLGKRGISAGSFNYSNIAISSNGETFVACDDNGYDNNISVLQFNGTDWGSVGTPGFSGTQIQELSLALTPSDQPVIGFNINGDGSLFLSVMNYGELFDIGERESMDFSIYPNPASKFIIIKIPNLGNVIKDIEITNTLGSESLAILSNDNPIRVDISNLPSGLYFLNVRTSNTIMVSKFYKI
jgi:hypothetical protein